jgi:hypothetical protein
VLTVGLTVRAAVVLGTTAARLLERLLSPFV